MTNEEIITAIESELKNKTLGVTEQYLEVHTPVYNNNQVVIERIDRVNSKLLLAYVPVQGQKFYFNFNIDTETKSVLGLSTEDHINLYVDGISENMSKEDRASLAAPDSFENKLETLLNILERDIETSKVLIEEKDSYIRATIHSHNVNTMFSGIVLLDKKAIKRMAALDLGIDVDLFTVGNSLK